MSHLSPCSTPAPGFVLLLFFTWLLQSLSCVIYFFVGACSFFSVCNVGLSKPKSEIVAFPILLNGKQGLWWSSKSSFPWHQRPLSAALVLMQLVHSNISPAPTRPKPHLFPRTSMLQLSKGPVKPSVSLSSKSWDLAQVTPFILSFTDGVVLFVFLMLGLEPRALHSRDPLWLS